MYRIAMPYNPSLLQSCLLAMAALQSIVAVQFDVDIVARKTPGGVRFEKEIGVEFAKQTMEASTNFIWKLFEENTAADRKDYQKVLMVIENYGGGVEAMGYGNTINISAVFIGEFQGNLRLQFTSLIYHEMTHIWQWSGNGQAPGGLTEGFADYTVLKSNYVWPGFAKPGVGERWDEGYQVTARFLEYCDGIRPGFPAALNKKMRYAFTVDYFVELLGKPVDQLWREYKAKYGGGGGGVASNGEY